MLRDLAKLLRVHQWVKNLLVFVAPLLGIFVGRDISPTPGIIMAIYVLVSLIYSKFLKTQPLVDIFVLSLLYTVRRYSGAKGRPAVAAIQDNVT